MTEYCVLRIQAPTGLDASIASISEVPAASAVGAVIKTDAYGVIHAFGKWTFTSISEAAAERNTDGMWRGFVTLPPSGWTLARPRS